MHSNGVVDCLSTPRIRQLIPGPWPSRVRQLPLPPSAHPREGPKRGTPGSSRICLPRTAPHTERFGPPLLVPAQFLAGVVVVVHVFLPEHSHDRLSRLTRTQATPAPRPEPSPPPPRRCGPLMHQAADLWKKWRGE